MVNTDNQNDLEKLSDDEVTENGIFIDDDELGKIPLIAPYDSIELRTRKEEIIDKRVNEIARSWDLSNEEMSNRILKKMIYDVGNEVFEEIERKKRKRQRVSKLLINRFKEMETF